MIFWCASALTAHENPLCFVLLGSVLYLPPPALGSGSGDERRVAAHHRRVLHEHAVRQRLVRGQLQHLQPEPVLQNRHVFSMLLLRFEQVHLQTAGPQRVSGQRLRHRAHHGVRKAAKPRHQPSHRFTPSPRSHRTLRVVFIDGQFVCLFVVLCCGSARARRLEIWKGEKNSVLMTSRTRPTRRAPMW